MSVARQLPKGAMLDPNRENRGPTVGTTTVDPLEFLARLVTHIPDPGQVMQRY